MGVLGAAEAAPYVYDDSAYARDVYAEALVAGREAAAAEAAAEAAASAVAAQTPVQAQRAAGVHAAR
jgi:hypothetical protein